MNNNELLKKTDEISANESSFDSVAPEVSNTINVSNNNVGGGADYNSETGSQISGFGPSIDNQSVNDGKKKKKKWVIWLVAVLVVILIVVVVFFCYIKINFSAGKFIDDNVSEFSTWIDKAFANTQDVTLNGTQKDGKTSGSLTFSTNSSELNGLNSLSLDYSIESSIKSEYEKVGLALKENGISVLSGNVYLDKDTLYIDSPEVYSQVLKYSLGENPFNFFSDDSFNTLMNTDNIKNALKNVIKYFGEALKEADMSTSTTGMSVEYKYVINDKNNTKVKDKFISLIKKDSVCMSLIELYDFDLADLTFDNMTLVIKVNMLSNDIEKIEMIDSNNVKITGTKISTGKYKFVSSDETDYVEVEFNDDKIIITPYIDGKEDGQFSISTDGKTVKIYLGFEGVNINMTISTSDSNKTTMKLEMDSEEITLNINLNVDASNTNIIKYDGEIMFNATGDTLGANFKGTKEYGENLVTKKMFSNTRNIDTLTDEEQSEIRSNLLDKLNKLTIFWKVIPGQEDIIYPDSEF